MTLQFSDNAARSASTDNSPQKMLKSINDLLKTIQRDPFQGIDKPKLLRHVMGGYWSRRSNDEHRIAFKVEQNVLVIAQVWYHYV